ncbi:hypothetical protein CPB83DRAFT_854030 [Crepidotus variabilis]|uniref:Uncharacterized protein n=1 Tax=Crepidotus variabilis TaxID=179855 RepID=A0A9P6JQJ9_9AGAR|nr:hypothetical protein CPB83DRAFT_854030 [Crepidotus variabilis]
MPLTPLNKRPRPKGSRCSSVSTNSRPKMVLRSSLVTMMPSSPTSRVETGWASADPARIAAQMIGAVNLTMAIIVKAKVVLRSYSDRRVCCI